MNKLWSVYVCVQRSLTEIAALLTHYCFHLPHTPTLPPQGSSSWELQAASLKKDCMFMEQSAACEVERASDLRD